MAPWLDDLRHLVDLYDAQPAGRDRPVHAYVFGAQERSVTPVVASSPQVTVERLVGELTGSRRGGKALGAARAIAVVHARPTYPTAVLEAMDAALDADPTGDLTRFGTPADHPDARQFITAQLVARDGWIGETGRLAGVPWSAQPASTNDTLFTLHDEPEIAALVTAVRATGDYTHRENPRDTRIPSARLPDLLPVARDLADRYEASASGDRPPRLYALGFDLAGLAEIGGPPHVHPIAFLTGVMDDPEGLATVRGALLLAVAAESWAFPRDVLAEIASAQRDDPDLDIAARFGTPSQHPRRVDVGQVTLITRDGRQAALTRPRDPDATDAVFQSTDHGDRFSGTLPVELEHMLAVTD